MKRHHWWLTGPDRPATSVTFLLDRSGVIRFIHPGMEYHDASGPEGHPMCADDLAAIRTAIERLLAEPGGQAGSAKALGRWCSMSDLSWRRATAPA